MTASGGADPIASANRSTSRFTSGCSSGFQSWTILLYTLAWGPVNGVHGAGWLAVVIGVFLDFATYSARAAQSRYQARGV